jgi:hypothetical protein
MATRWTVRGSSPGAVEIFRTRPERPWDSPSLLYDRYRVSFPGINLSERGDNYPFVSSAEAKERVELYLYSASGASFSVVGRTLTFVCFTTFPHSAHKHFHCPTNRKECERDSKMCRLVVVEFVLRMWRVRCGYVKRTEFYYYYYYYYLIIFPYVSYRYA